MGDASDEAIARLTEAMESGDPEALASVADKHSWQLATGHYELLIEALGKIPQEVLDKYDNLKLLHPLTPVILRTDPDYLLSATIADLGSLDEWEINKRLSTLLVGQRLRGSVKLALDTALRLEERLRSGRGLLTTFAQSLIPQLRFQIGVTLLLDGQTELALKSFSTARQFASVISIDHSQRDAFSRSAVTHAFRGSLVRAQNDIERSRALPSASPFFEPFIQRAERIAATMVALERMVPDLDSIVEELDPVDTFDELWPFFALICARYELLRGHPTAALDALSLAYHAHRWESDTMAGDIRASSLVQAFLALGEVSSARAVCEEAGDRLPLTRLARVRVLMFEGSFSEAAYECRLLSGAREMPPVARAEAVLLLAWITYEAEEALDLTEARSIAQLAFTGDFRRLFSTVPKELIDAACEQLPETDAWRVREALSGVSFSPPLPQRPKLSPRELKVLEELVGSATTAEIAARLFVTQNTVRSQLASIYRKLGVRNRADAITLATRLNLFG